MKLQQNFTIEGTIVQKEDTFLGFDVYKSSKGCDEEVTLYFVNSKGDVVGTMEIGTDCGQNVGYVSGIAFKGVKP